VKEYRLKPFMTSTSQRNAPTDGKPAAIDSERFPHQPLPSPRIDPSKPRICLGLDVHLASITGVAQKGSWIVASQIGTGQSQG